MCASKDRRLLSPTKGYGRERGMWAKPLKSPITFGSQQTLFYREDFKRRNTPDIESMHFGRVGGCFGLNAVITAHLATYVRTSSVGNKQASSGRTPTRLYDHRKRRLHLKALSNSRLNRHLSKYVTLHNGYSTRDTSYVFRGYRPEMDTSPSRGTASGLP